MDALLRDETRAEMLQTAIGAKRVSSADLAETQRRKLSEHPQEKIRLQAQRILTP